MTVTLTDEQWDVVRDAADEMAEFLDYDTCNDPECRHLDCRRNRPQADAIRRVIGNGVPLPLGRAVAQAVRRAFPDGQP